MFLSPILKLSNIESKIELESLINCDFFDSLIIKNKRLFNTIMNHTEDIILKNYGIIMNRNLIHRASEYSLCPRSFRHNCQMRGPTIILMRTVDRVCIAFSSKDWMMFGGYKESKGFIGIFGFEDDLELTLECIETRGTYDHNLFGPIFGFSGINDLALSGHVSRSNTTRLFGSKEFDIIEYEVYN